MNGLEDPGDFAGVGVQRENGGRVLFDAWAAVSAVLIRRLIAHWQIDQSKFRIVTGHAPGIGRVGAVGLAVWQRRGRIGILGIEVPYQRARIYVVGADDARGRRCRHIVVDRPTDDDKPVRYHRG